ncbi:MAG: helix-turn-helix transcriptional regulator [Serratia sp. (in: enterobacteria)]|uniref:helix-turn-helix transcriptional regulator n=1 Tax=Serratia sp. (in: enterobacteria) TaxID=616 RepID=UPI003F3F1B2D
MIYLASDDRYFILGVETLFCALKKPLTIIPLNEVGETVVIPALTHDDTLILAVEQTHTLTRLLTWARRHDARALLLMDNASERTLDNITQWSQGVLSKKMPLVSLPLCVEAGNAHLKDLSFLTAREINIMGSLATGKTPYRISRELNLSVKTIFSHKLSALKKLGLNHLNARSVLIFGKIFQGLAPL